MKPTKSNPTLSERVITLIEEARRKVAVSANIALVYTYYEIGRMIVEKKQAEKKSAEKKPAKKSTKKAAAKDEAAE